MYSFGLLSKSFQSWTVVDFPGGRLPECKWRMLYQEASLVVKPERGKICFPVNGPESPIDLNEKIALKPALMEIGQDSCEASLGFIANRTVSHVEAARRGTINRRC